MAERDLDISELPLDTAGAMLRRAREQAGLSRSDIATRTKIAERHLASIEDGNYAALASRTYAIGFARNYARALGLDEMQVAAAVRQDFDGMDPLPDRRTPATYEQGDPARVPGSRLAWMAALAAIALVAVIAFFWRDFYAPGATLPDLAPSESPAMAANAVSPAPAAPASANGPVVFTAQEEGVWARFYDADGKVLLEKRMGMGESFTVPPDANEPLLRTARPDALQVTIGGQAVARVSDKQGLVKDVPVSAAALLARPAQVPAAAPATPPANPAAQSSQPSRPATAATIRVPLEERREGARREASRPPAPAQASAPAAPGADLPQPSTVSD